MEGPVEMEGGWILKKFSWQSYLVPENFCQKTADSKLPKKYFSVLLFIEDV